MTMQVLWGEAMHQDNALHIVRVQIRDVIVSNEDVCISYPMFLV